MAAEHETEMLTVKPLCKTRWTVRHHSLDHILRQYGILIEALEEVSTLDSCRGQDVSVKAAGLVVMMRNTTTYFALCVTRAVFGACEDLATSLQGREFLISETLAAVRILEGQLAMMAKDKFLEDLWSKAKGVEKDLDWEEPAPKRRRQPTEKLRDQGVTADPISETVKDKAIREAKAGIGGLLTSVKERFADSGFRFVLQVNEVLLSAVKGIFIEDSICAIVIHLKDDLDIHRLRRHLGYLPQLCPKAVSVMEVILAVKGA